MTELANNHSETECSDELATLIISRVEDYVRDLEGNRGLPLHEMIVMAAERPLIKWAMTQCGNNQKAAAQLLGINRNTLHKKLVLHGFLPGKH
ncbi:MAG: Fis family transcriptional regulator [Duodenibacillus sp.]|nr:Fis family transcriptional regulator [Duodenibacillus sp.]